MIKKDFIQELLIKPTPEDLKIYKRMGLDEYVSPTGARYPLNKPKVERDLRLEGQLPVNPDAGMFDRLETMDKVQSLGDYFQASSELFPPKSRINRDFVDSLAADEHPDVSENKSKLPPMADPDKPLTHFADNIPPTGIPDIADPQGLTADIKQPVSEDAVRALAQIPKGLARGTESVVGTLGSMARWTAERTKIGDVLTKHIDLPGVGVVAEYLVRKFGPKKPTKYFDERMTQYAGMGEKWADFWEEQTQKGWEAPNPEVTQAKWRDLPITKGAATISEAAPNYLAAIAGSVLTKSPQTGLLFISALSGAGAYRRQRKAGAGKQKANAIAALTGAWEYVTEKVPFDEVFKPAKSKFLKMLKLGTMEAAQEFVQGIGENFLEYFGYKAKDLKSVPAAVKEGLEHTMDGWVENVVAGAGLGVMGGGIVPKGGLQKPTGKDKTPPTEAKEAPERPAEAITKPEAKITPAKVEPAKQKYWGRPELKEDYTPKPYLKVKATIAVVDKKGEMVGMKARTFWAYAKEIKEGRNVFQEVTKEGTKKAAMTIVDKTEIIETQPALVNKHYGELEIIKEAEPAKVEKKPWEMTKGEFIEREAAKYKDKLDEPTLEIYKEQAKKRHWKVVHDAVLAVKQGRIPAEKRRIPRQVLEEYKSEKWAQEALKVVAPKVEKEIKYEKEAITEPTPSPKVEPREARKLVPTGKLDPTNPKEALEIIKLHKQGSRMAFEGIYKRGREWDKEIGEYPIVSVEYTHEQIDTAYRTIQKPVPSPMPDTELFVMPGKEAQMKAVAQKMTKMKGVVKPKKFKGIKPLPKPTALPRVAKDKEGHVKAVYMAAAKESERYNITGVLVEGDNLVATDGRRMFVAKGKWGKDGLYLDVAALKKGLLGKASKEKELNFPRWREIVPDVSDLKPILVRDLETILSHVRQAAIITTEESKGVMIIENKDGSLGFASSAPEVGHAEINVYEGGRILGAVNPRFLLDAIKYHAIRGDKEIEFFFPHQDRPILTRSLDGKTNTITMPINIGEPTEALREAIIPPAKVKPKQPPTKVEPVVAPKVEGKYRSESEQLTAKAETKAKETLPIDVKANDIDFQKAVRAASGTHMIPENSAYIKQRDYLNTMMNVYNEMAPLAKSNEQKDILKTELERFKNNYIKWQNDIMGSESGIVSSFIAGPSKFPVRQMNKRQNALQNKMNKYFEWKEKAIKSIKKNIKYQAIEDAGGPIAVQEKKIADAEKIQEAMKKANAIIRKKALSDKQKIQQIVKDTDLSESTARKALETDYMGKKGFAGWQLSNNLANIKRMKQRLSEMKLAAEKTGENIIKTYDGVEILNNFDEERVQLLFDEKPDENLRNELKQSGWHWSPKNKAWQRKNTEAAIRNSKQILDKHFAEQPPAQVKGKRVISEESYQKAKKRLADRTTMRMGVDPQGFADLVTIGAYHVENGLRTFAEWSKKMIEIYGKSVKPQLQNIWNQVKPLSQDEVENFPKEFLTSEQRTKAEMGEIPSEGEFKSQSGAFNEHLDYFQKRQLPKKSKIPAIQARMRTINGLRLAGKVSAKAANKAIIDLRQHLFKTAIDEGVALRMTRGGKVSLSVRKAGTYVPEEFAQYSFKNIRPILGGGQDITRAIQQMDGSLSVKVKLREKGQAGPLERHVLWATRDISLQKLKFIKEKTAELKSIFKTKKGSKEDEQVNLILEKIAKEDRTTPIKDILSRKTLRAIASPKVIQQAIQLREYYDSLIEEQNLAREMRDQDPIPYRHNYSPHILRDTTIWERLMMRGKKPKDIKGDLPDYIKPNAPFNPRAMAREAGIPYEERIRSAQRLAESYLVTAAKDIFNTSIVQNNKAFIQQLDAMGYDKSANYLADWTAEAYAGVKPRLDRAIQIGRKGEKSARYFNRLRNMAVFPLNFSWSLLTQTSSLALTVGRYGSTNTLRGFVQWLNPKIRKQTAENYYSYVVKSEKQGKITRQDAQNLIGVNVKLRRTKTEIAHDISTLLLDQLEKLLTGTSIRAAHLHGQKRGLTGEALKNYASDGGAKTQSMYNDEDKPALLRNLLVKTAAPYQTFAYEVVNTMREWAGRTGTPPDSKLYTIWTIIRFLAAASVFAAIGKKYGNKEIWSWKRPPIPFAEFWLNPIVKMFSNQWIGSASGLTSPVETATRVAKGIEDVLETGSWRKLRNELTKYGPGILGVPGGIQISRTVDAIIAYAQGGVKDRKGRLLFEMEDPQDLVQAIFSGVWTTEGGRAYLDIDYRLKNMSVKELRQYRRKNTYQKTQYPKSKGIIKGRPHKGREQLIEKIDRELEKR